ncbi:MAG: hypothetical protein COT74_04090 [Bdellovibrionales bacterium CG10_big_fil_rev_8_21_14_0_10_45_34]|nr:MAG: hypothetical protein COT74_04090 [Bdellovibrionales bacterium CG10_big_fil_rev_8_21_14_0_10_45_34]
MSKVLKEDTALESRMRLLVSRVQALKIKLELAVSSSASLPPHERLNLLRFISNEFEKLPAELDAFPSRQLVNPGSKFSWENTKQSFSVMRVRYIKWSRAA